MPFRNRPLVPIAIFYICGIAFAKYFFVPLWLCFLIIVGGIFTGKPPYKNIFFYLSIFIIGVLFYQLSPNINFSPRCDFLKENIRKIIYYNMPNGEEKDFLTGLLLGERYGIKDELTNALRCTNTMHILSISGDHIGFVGIMLFAIFRILFIPRKISAILAFFIVFAYVSVVGWQAPSFRAAVMFGVFALAWVIDRPADIINSLALAALIILIITPLSLFDAGFQLSFVIVLVLLVAGSRISGGWLKKTLYGSFIAWIGSLPLIAYYFKIISPISILANLVVVPSVSIIIALGFTSVLLGNIYLPIAGIFNATIYFLTEMLIKFITLMSKIPYSYFRLQNFPVYLVFILYISMVIAFFSLLKKDDIVVE